MNKNIKIIIIGFGSIGQRHYNNLLNLGFSNIFIYDPDEQLIINSEFRIKNINHENLKNFDVAFICSPNNLHIEHALKCAQAGCDLFIEKPLSHNIDKIDKLINICDNKNLINLVACNMRFHPCLNFIKNYLDENKLGEIYNINHECGYYLPYWRPDQDYRKNYACKKETGGGIILDDIHEFDLLFWLNNFNDVFDYKLIFDKVGDLEIETEDSCIASFKFKNKVLGLVRCDYLQKNYSRNCKIVGEHGNLEWDFNENVVWLKTKDKIEKLFEKENFDFNNVYIDEVKYFFDCVEKRKNTFNNIKIAKDVLKYCVNKKFEPISKNLCIIQARMGAARLPGKVLKKVDNMTLLEYEINRVKKSKKISKIVVATSNKPNDDAIEKECNRLGIDCFRGSEDDVLGRYYECSKKYPEYENIIRITGDCPLIDPEIIDKVINVFKQNNLDYASNTLKETFPDGMDIEIFKKSVLEEANINANLLSQREHVTQYIIKNNKFKKGNLSSRNNLGHFRLTVDEPKDFEVIKFLIENCELDASYLDYIATLTKNPEAMIKNMNIVRNEGLIKSLKEDYKIN
ncbi:MAG: Gfo/Idh/MocA family oxidoreductase [Candidatus Falkowbacteria bacterium]